MDRLIVEIIAGLVAVLLLYVTKRWGGAWKQVGIVGARIVEHLRASIDDAGPEKVDGEELVERYEQVKHNQMSNIAADALEHAADVVSAERDPERRKVKNPLKRAGKLLVRTVAENAVTNVVTGALKGTLGKIFKRR